jgi:hypothetical protein
MQRVAHIWEGSTSGDYDVPLATFVPVTGLASVTLIEARRIAGGQWDRIALIPLDDIGLDVRPAVYLRDYVATLVNYPAAWAIYNAIRFRGPAIGTVPPTYALTLAPNDLIAPLFCRALWLDCAIYLSIKAQDSAKAASLRKEYIDVVNEMLRQVRSTKISQERRFPEGEADA